MEFYSLVLINMINPCLPEAYTIIDWPRVKKVDQNHHNNIEYYSASKPEDVRTIYNNLLLQYISMYRY